MKEHFPNLVKELGMSPGGSEVTNKMDAKRPMPRHIIIKMLKVNDKERLLKAARENQLVIYREIPIRLSTIFSKETFQARRDWQEVFKSDEKQRPTT